MPFDRPSLTTIFNRIKSDFVNRITGADSLLRRSMLNIIARVNAGGFHNLYGYLDYQALQFLASTASSTNLDTIADEFGISRNDAVKAEGTAAVIGTAGIVIPAGTELQSSEGFIYLTDNAVTIGGGDTVDVDFTAELAGAAGNDDAGVILSFVSPITSVNSTATVDSDGIFNGTDIETDDALRTRVLNRKRQPPHGGAELDYENWALEVAGVTRAWSVPLYQGPGTIGLAFVRDGDVSIIPNESQRDTVRDYIISHTDPASGKTVGIPVTAEPGFFMIELSFDDLNIEINLDPNTTEVQNNVRSELQDLILREGGVSETLFLSRISEAISLANKEVKHIIVSPTTDQIGSSTTIHRLGTTIFNNY
jgi:uncharacterized phage protein gp47/JayE